ncbi:hypothetical protein EDD85DRAFT_956965 [Armillaria nabsnona]|nr:hypothetical protein EDD85DRAFT_956965 [Armillaria nabsnona]
MVVVRKPLLGVGYYQVKKIHQDINICLMLPYKYPRSVAQFRVIWTNDWNSALQRSPRRVNFDIDALQRIASSTVGAQRCIPIESLPQGPLFDGIAMDGLHPYGVPPLEDRWLITFDEDIGVVIHELIHFDIDIHQRPFSQIGRLFLREDVIPELQSRPLYLRESDNKASVTDKYRIEPIVDNQYWFGGEEPVVGDRGPDMTTLLQATCCLALRRAEYQAVSAASSCPTSSSLLSRSKPDDLPELRQLLHHCISMVQHNRSVFRAANVVPYIDWQGATATPYLMGPDLPPAIHYEGSLLKFTDDPFSLPEIAPDIPPELKDQADPEWRLAKRHRAIANILLRNVPMRFATACVHRLDLLRSLPDTASRCYVDGPYRLRHLVFEMYKEWSVIMEGSASPAECPVQLTTVEIAREREDYAAYLRYQRCRDEALATIRCDPDGWMSEENAGVVRQRWAVAREKWNEDEASSPFPLDDGTQSFHLT